MFENSIFKIEFSILLGLFPHHNLYRLTFQSFVLRELDLDFHTARINYDFIVNKDNNQRSFYKYNTFIMLLISVLDLSENLVGFYFI